jgi:hypothetical protein
MAQSHIWTRHSEAAPRRGRVGVFAARTLTGLLLVFAGLEAAIVLPPALTTGIDVTWGMDFRAYLVHTVRWLGGGFYLPEQLAGPYIVEDITGAVYPPVLLYLLVPFAWGAPWALWWLVPLGIVAAAVARSRPSPWQWVALAAILVYPRTWTVIVLGNPAMWALAALAAGMVWKWPAVFVALKVTFAPLVLVGIRDRGWWTALGIAAILTLPFAPMLPDFVVAVLNAQTSRGIEYTLGEWPIALLLVVGLLRHGRAEGDDQRRSRDAHLDGTRLAPA